MTYTVRAWRTLPTGHPSVTVVDDRGEVVHITIPRAFTDHDRAQLVIEHALRIRPRKPRVAP